MPAATIEAYIENGQIKLPPNVQLPNSGQVYIVIPDPKAVTHRVFSPRLAKPEQAEYLRKTLVEENPDAGLRPPL